MTRNTAQWRLAYRRKDALWIHDGNMKRPHALLASGNHSNGFFNSRRVIPDETLLRGAASDLLELFAEQGGDFTKIQKAVVGPQTGATKLAQFLSDRINYPFTWKACVSASPAKSEDCGVKSMILSNEEQILLRDRSILLCDDVLTTCGSAGLAADAVTNAGGIVLPFILALVNRSGFKEVNGKQIIALIDHPMPMWSPKECLLCKEGSEAILAKDPVNWARLNAEY